MSDFRGFARGPEGSDPPDDFDWTVRTHVYAAFGRSGKAPSVGDLAALTGASPGRVKASLLKLQEAHEVAARDGGEGVWMAHPFSAVPTAYPVQTPDFTCHANCAWDALGVPAILGTDGWTDTRCAATDEPVAFGVEKGGVVGDEAVIIHLLTPLRHAWDDIGFT